MPNWCISYISVQSEDKLGLQILSDNVDLWTSYNAIENGFGTHWLGNIVLNSGLGTIDTSDPSHLECRGYLESIELVENELIVQTCTAWRPMLQIWTRLAESYLSEYDVIYTCEEPGMGIYYTNDPANNDYILRGDYEKVFGCGEQYVDERLLVQLLQALLKVKITDVDKLIDMFESSEYHKEAGISGYEFVDISDLD